MEHEQATGHPLVSVGRTAELSALLFGTTELAHVLADVLAGDGADAAVIDEVIDLRQTVGSARAAGS